MMSRNAQDERWEQLVVDRRAIFGPDGMARDDGRPLYRDCGDQRASNERCGLVPVAKSLQIDVQALKASFQTMIASNRQRWAHLSFKLTEEQYDSFTLEAGLRKMTRKELFLSAVRHYLAFHPSTERAPPQKRGRSNGKRWRDRSFKVTPAERDEFVLEAAKRRMTSKGMFLVAMQFYRDTNPVPRR
ncbi:hypothetical protein ACRBEV_06180 [Methylobacterium phyllosphaerae]